MAKSKRSKVKMAYKAMRRRVLEPAHDAKIREQAAKVYSAIGLNLPNERTIQDTMAERSHGGSVLVTAFHPTEPGPTLNLVHGPRAQEDPLLQREVPVVGFPNIGVGLDARILHETGDDLQAMEAVQTTTGSSEETPTEKRYFYPKRPKKSTHGIRKQSKRKSRHPKNKPGVQFV